MKKIIKCVFIALIVSTSAIAQEQIDLFILAGQSNAQGWKGNGASYPSDPNNLDPQIRLNSTFIDDSDTGGWTTMKAQPGRYDDGHFGLEVNFSRKLKQAGYNPAIFKYTKGASGLFVDWKQPGAGGYYDDMVIALRTAILELENLGHTVNVKCFVWIQGEEDAKNTTYTAAYENNLLLLINDLRNNVVYNNSLPMLIGSDFYQGMQVINIQKSIANNDDNIIFTSMEGLEKADNTHLTPAGLVAHGEVVFNDYEATFINVDTECPIATSGTLDVIEVDESWGKSFEAACSGNLTSVDFNSPTTLNNGVTLLIKDGADINAATIHTQNIAQVINGNNTASIIGNVPITDGNTYYFQIVSFGCSVSIPETLDVILADKSWGKSFESVCTGNLTSVDFNLPTALTNGGTLLIKDGMDSNASIIHTQSITEITNDDNTVSILGNIPVLNGNTYYLQIDAEPIVTGCSIISEMDRIATLDHQSWGQSFEAECAGFLTSITFNSSQELPSGATLYVKDGTDCSANTLHSQIINVTNSDNEIILSSTVSVEAATMYYFQVVSNNGETFRIGFRNPGLVTGNLSTHVAGATDPLVCDWNFGGFDWGFSVVIDDTLSIDDLPSDINQPKIYPNPTTNKFTITESKNSIIEVYDLMGKRMMSKKIENNNQSFDISDFDSGVYFVKINNEGSVKTMKIIKK